MLIHKFESIYSQTLKGDRGCSCYYRWWLAVFVFASVNWLSALSLLAASPPPGTVIDNQATGSFTDPTDNTEKQIESNIVRVEIAEVAGITITGIATEEAPSNVNGAGANQNDGNVNPNDVVYFIYRITNVGNDPSQIFIPGAPSAIAGGSQQGNIEIIEYDPDGTGATAASDLRDAPIEVPNAGISTGDPNALDLPNGSIPAEGTVTIRVPVKLSPGLSEGSTVAVTMGDTGDNDNSATTQNQIFSAGTNDVYTQDNPDGTTGETDGNPLNGDTTNHRQEASYKQVVTVTKAATPSVPQPAASCPAGLGGVYATWSKDAENSGTGVFNSTSPNVASVPNFSWAATGDVSSTGIDSSETFANNNQFENIYGQADSASNLNARVNNPNPAANEGAPITQSSTITLTFDRPTPSVGFGISIIDIESNQVRFRAKDADGNVVPVATIASWFVEAFDANPSSGGDNTPSWDPAEAALIGDQSPTPVWQTTVANNVGDNEAGAGWLQPDIPLSELTIEDQSLYREIGADPSMHIYMASCLEQRDYADTPADGGTAPDGSGTTGYGNASHIIANGTQLGANIDAEVAALNSADANGDGTDDDGITIPALNSGQTATITANVSGTEGYLQGWIDWDGNGSFDTEEQIATDIQDNGAKDTDNTAGTISFDVTVPSGAITTADTFARFRWSTAQGLDPTTAANDGEVEDYQIAIATSPVAGSQPFVCDSSLYLVIGDSKVPYSQLGRINRSVVPFAFDTIGLQTTDYSYNALAYNPVDNYLYAIVNNATASSQFASGEVLKIGADGVPASLGIPQGDSVVNNPNSATFLADGTYVIAKQSESIYTLDLTTTPPTATSRGTVPRTKFEDIAVNPYDTTPNRIYGIDDNSDRLVYFNLANPGAGATPAISGGVTTDHNHGSQFYDLFGNLLYRSATTSALYVVNPDGTDTLIANTPVGGSHDGASCFAIGLRKEVDATEPVPAGQNVTYTYTIGNSSATPMTVTLTDDLRSVTDYPNSGVNESGTPVNGTYTGTINTPSGTVALSNSDRTLTISDVSLAPQSLTTITAEVAIPESTTPETYYNQAEIQGLPPGFVSVIESDYPTSSLFGDPTPIEVIEPVASDPNLLLVKRITAINPGRNDEIRFNNFVDDPNTPNDNAPNWPDSDGNASNNINTYLRGVSKTNNVKPGDEVEYTIYFLSNGDAEAKGVKICDVIPDDTTFVKNTYGVEVGVGLELTTANPPSTNPPTIRLSNLIGDEADLEDEASGAFYGANTTPPAFCKKPVLDDSSNSPRLDDVNSSNNISGTVLVEIQDPLPPATSPGDPIESYGFVRFRVRVD